MKFVLISQQGSGSNLLRAFLNSHDNILCDDELFVSRRDKTGPFQQSNLSIKEYLDLFYSEHKGKKTGFDLKYNQINKDIMSYIINNKIKIIHLKRNTGRTFLRGINKNSNPFTYEDLKKYCEEVNDWKATIDNLKPFKITYEEMTLGKQIINLEKHLEKRILDFFNLDYQKLYINKDLINNDLIIRY